MRLNKKDRMLLEKKIYNMVLESFFGGYEGFNEKESESNESDSRDYDDDDDVDDENTYTKYGYTVIGDGDGIDDAIWSRLRTILPTLQDNNDDSVHSFNLTRSQIAYSLWPELDKDSARSKLSQKIEGNKSWREWELNKLANIISGNAA